jgi:hypothetical protein
MVRLEIVLLGAIAVWLTLRNLILPSVSGWAAGTLMSRLTKGLVIRVLSEAKQSVLVVFLVFLVVVVTVVAGQLFGSAKPFEFLYRSAEHLEPTFDWFEHVLLSIWILYLSLLIAFAASEQLLFARIRAQTNLSSAHRIEVVLTNRGIYSLLQNVRAIFSFGCSALFFASLIGFAQIHGYSVKRSQVWLDDLVVTSDPEAADRSYVRHRDSLSDRDGLAIDRIARQFELDLAHLVAIRIQLTNELDDTKTRSTDFDRPETSFGKRAAILLSDFAKRFPEKWEHFKQSFGERIRPHDVTDAWIALAIEQVVVHQGAVSSDKTVDQLTKTIEPELAGPILENLVGSAEDKLKEWIANFGSPGDFLARLRRGEYLSSEQKHDLEGFAQAEKQRTELQRDLHVTQLRDLLSQSPEWDSFKDLFGRPLSKDKLLEALRERDREIGPRPESNDLRHLLDEVEEAKQPEVDESR